MVYITADNEIMTCGAYDVKVPTQIINNTGYFPISVYANVILLSDYKLYAIVKLKLVEIIMDYGIDYVVDSDNFTDKFAMINSECYQIYYKYGLIQPYLQKISVEAKKAQNIISVISRYIYYYYCVNTDNKLIVKMYSCIRSLHNVVYLDKDVDLLLQVCLSETHLTVIYKKNNDIICSSYDDHILVGTYVITRINSTIIKTLHNFLLDSDANIYEIVFEDNRYSLKKNAMIRDFNVWNNKFYYFTDNDNYHNHNISHPHCVCINISNNCRFKKSPRNVKSATKIYD
jgi:hypothetical protein